MTTPYPPPTAEVGNTSTAIRAIAEAAPPRLALVAGSTRVATLTTTLVVPSATPGPSWTQSFPGFTRVDGYLAAVRSSSVSGAGGKFNNRAVYPYCTSASPVNPLPLTGAELAGQPYALSAGAGMDVPAATYVIDFLAWGV